MSIDLKSSRFAADILQVELPPRQADRADILRRAVTYMRAYARAVGDNYGDIGETIAVANKWIKELEK